MNLAPTLRHRRYCSPPKSRGRNTRSFTISRAENTSTIRAATVRERSASVTRSLPDGRGSDLGALWQAMGIAHLIMSYGRRRADSAGYAAGLRRREDARRDL